MGCRKSKIRKIEFIPIDIILADDYYIKGRIFSDDYYIFKVPRSGDWDKIIDNMVAVIENNTIYFRNANKEKVILIMVNDVVKGIEFGNYRCDKTLWLEK